MLKTIVIAVGCIVVLGLLLAYLVGPGKNAASQPTGGEQTMSTQPSEKPSIDLDRPSATETAAFALG
jgi:hypothetical protein